MEDLKGATVTALDQCSNSGLVGQRIRRRPYLSSAWLALVPAHEVLHGSRFGEGWPIHMGHMCDACHKI